MFEWWNRNSQITLVVILAYAVLGILSFPVFYQGYTAYLFVVPLILWAFTKPSKRRFLTAALIAEFLRCFITIIWLRHVTLIGTILVCVALSLLLIPFFLRLRFVFTDYGQQSRWVRLAHLLSLPAIWVIIEWLRIKSWALPWSPLALSQTQYPPLIQNLDTFGVYGISFFVVTVNMLIALWIRSVFRKGLSGIFGRVELWFLLLICMTFTTSSLLKYFQSSEEKPLFKAAIVQPNQPAYLSWNRENMHETLNTAFRLSAEARDLDFDIMFWPEGTLPWAVIGENNIDAEVSMLVRNAIRRPLLMGNHAYIGDRMINGVFHYQADGRRLEPHYEMQVLVPFGQYVPFREYLGFLETVVPFGGDFSPGSQPLVMQVDTGKGLVDIAPIICYEDVFPHVSSEAVKQDVDIFYVATYNVWYGKEAAAYQHAAHSILRAVENRRPFIRCGSGGWSGWIDEKGRMREVVVDDKGSIYHRGVGIVTPVQAAQYKGVTTFYARFGDWWVGVCALFLCMQLIVRLIQRDYGK